jgi:hypothetical protein
MGNENPRPSLIPLYASPLLGSGLSGLGNTSLKGCVSVLTNEAYSRVLINAQLASQGWNTQHPNLTAFIFDAYKGARERPSE